MNELWDRIWKKKKDRKKRVKDELGRDLEINIYCRTKI